MHYIRQMEPCFDEKEKKALSDYMESGGWLMEFEQTREFERLIAEYTGAKYCSVLPNGTISLSVALMACGVEAGDEVIVPDYTMVATPNAAELIGAKAVFVDIDRNTLCMDIEEMKKAITSKTKAVLFVSINGRCPVNIEEYISICKKRNIFFVEDAAQSLGSWKDGKHIGTFGDIGSFSFSVPKIITTGQGGALITDNKNLYDKIKLIKDFGREKGGCDHYIQKGWNFKFTDLQAVIGIQQMKKLKIRVHRKREMQKIYYEQLHKIKQIELLNGTSSDYTPWFFEILCENRKELQKYLENNNIGTRIFYPPLHSEPAYGYSERYPVTEEISSKGLWLPSSINLSDNDITYICKWIKMFYLSL